VRSAWLAGLCALLIAGSAAAARIEGRVLHVSKPDAVAGLSVQLLGVSRDGDTVTRETRSDDEGRFSFDDLPGESVYLLMADYAGVRFPGGREIFKAGQEAETRTLTFHVYEPSHDPAGLTVSSQRFFVERGDVGTYRVTQTLSAHSPRRQVIALGETEPPALRVGLLPGHGEIQTRFGGLPEGATLNGDVLELRGPFFPGEYELVVSYEVDTAGRVLESVLDLHDGAAQLELWVRDDGVEIDAGPLHSARVTRAEDGFYQRFLGFDLSPGTRIPFRVAARPYPGPGAIWPQVTLAFALSLGLAYVVGQPVTRRERAVDEPGESAASREKRALFAALRDLEHDFETGKLSQSDHDRLREELRSDALRALARLEGEEPASASVAGEASAGEAVAPDGGAAVLTCACGRTAAPGDRFCPSCGKAL